MKKKEINIKENKYNLNVIKTQKIYKLHKSMK